PGELEEVEAPVSRRILVLPASGDAQVLTFDRVARPSELSRGQRTARERGEGTDHRGHHGGGAAQPASRRRVAADLDVDPSVDAYPVDGRLRQVHHTVVFGRLVQAVLDDLVQVERLDPDAIVVPGPKRRLGVMVDRRAE